MMICYSCGCTIDDDNETNCPECGDILWNLEEDDNDENE